MGRSRYPFTQPEQPHVMTLTVVHWIAEDSMCAITLPLIAPTRAARPEQGFEDAIDFGINRVTLGHGVRV